MIAIVFFNWVLILNTCIKFSQPHSVNLKHPYYISITELEHNSKEKQLEISCKIFTNDLENVLRQNTKSYVDILHPKNKGLTSKIIREYLSNHLQVSIDGRKYKMEYLGYEIEEEAVWSYLQIKNIQVIKEIRIQNTILFDYKKEQINMMHVNINGIRKSTKLNYPDSFTSFVF